DAYERALAAHRERSIEVCRDARAAACVDEKATIEAIGAKLQACLAGTAVGPPSSELPPALTPTRAPRPAVVGFIEGVVGGGIALGNAQWRQAVAASPTFGARAGAIWRRQLGAMVSIEWTPQQLGG